jgi:Leucine rich repeat
VTIFHEKVQQIVAKAITCENFDDYDYAYAGREMTCNMMHTTSIDFPNVTISTRNDTISAVNFYDNKHILYLPINVVESFPNLVAYDAAFCSVKEVWKENFKSLGKLRHLNLKVNQIEKIASDVFDDLKELRILELREKHLVLISKVTNFFLNF